MAKNESKNRISLLICLVASFCASCSNDSASSDDDANSNACASPQVICDDQCISLDEFHWKSCHTCADGFEDKDQNPENGCEAKIEPKPEACDGDGRAMCDGKCIDLEEYHFVACNVCADGFEDKDQNLENGCESPIPSNPCADENEKECQGKCVVLSDLHWADCNVCAVGFEDKDQNPENGCEAEKQIQPLNCTNAQLECNGVCIDKEERHWTECGVCANGYEDTDENPENGCETRMKFSDGKCIDDSDCQSLDFVEHAVCENGMCQIQSCVDGYADCDGKSATGCEMAGGSNFYRCGARGACNDEEENSDNYKGIMCKLGDECRAGTCTPIPEIVGCSDGTREGFLDMLKFNNLAACSGAWTVPGIHHPGPACNRKSGNTGENRDGDGCNLEDLCAEGWHVCLGRGDVQTRSEYGCNGILDGMPQNEPYLFITRTSSTGNLNCDPDTVGVPLNMNDIFGCGNFGCAATGSECDPLTLSGHNNCQALTKNCGCRKQADGSVSCSSSGGECNGGKFGHSIDYFNLLNNKTYTPAWDCVDPILNSDGTKEAVVIVKSDPDSQGGVMCCKNQCEKDSDCGVGLICRFNVCVECIRNADGNHEGCPKGKTCNQQHKCV